MAWYQKSSDAMASASFAAACAASALPSRRDAAQALSTAHAHVVQL
jgi:hypothetical protein